MPTRSSSRRLARLSLPEFCRTCNTIAKPSSAVSTAMTAVKSRRRCAALLRSGTENPSSDRRRVAEDADAEHDHDRGRELAADAELVAEVDDQRGDEHVRHERDDEDLGVEHVVEPRSHPTEHCVQCGHDGDWQI